MQSGRCLQLSFGQRVELETAAFVPKPGIGVGDASHASGNWKRRRAPHGALNLGNHFRRVAGRAHPVDGSDLPATINFNLQHTNRVQQWRQFAGEDAVAVLAINVSGGVFPVIAWVGSGGDRWHGHLA